MESMFFGLPVITTKTTGSDFIVEDKKSGFIIDENNKSRPDDIKFYKDL